MDDLISRKALGERIKALKHQIASRAAGFVDEDSYECGAVDGLHDALTYTMEAPSAPAVPLDKLCKWLSRNAWAFDCEGCEGYCKAMIDCENEVGNNPEYWKNKLTNWMEGLDAAD